METTEKVKALQLFLWNHEPEQSKQPSQSFGMVKDDEVFAPQALSPALWSCGVIDQAETAEQTDLPPALPFVSEQVRR